jgi:Leucine Rich repeat
MAMAVALQVNKGLKYLDLYWRGGIGLMINSTLTTLGLGHNSIGDRGAKAPAQGLTHNATLEQLSLTSCSVGDGGTMALAEALISNATPQYDADVRWFGSAGRYS